MRLGCCRYGPDWLYQHPCLSSFWPAANDNAIAWAEKYQADRRLLVRATWWPGVASEFAPRPQANQP